MLRYIFLFLPFYVALLWFCLFALRKNKSRRQVVFSYILAILAVYFFVDGNYFIEKTDYSPMVIMDAVGCLAQLFLPIMAYVYVRSLQRRIVKSWLVVLMSVPAVLAFMSLLTCVFVMGVPHAAAFYEDVNISGIEPDGSYMMVELIYYYISFVVNDLLVAIEMIISIFFVVKTLIDNEFTVKSLLGYFKGESASSLSASCVCMLSLALVCILRVVLWRFLLIADNPLPGLLSFIVAVIIFFSSYLSLYLEIVPITSGSFYLPLAPIEGSVFPENEVKGDYPLQEKKEEDDVQVQSISRELAARLLEYFEEKKAYLNPEITVDSVSADLGTNRTYVSIFVNQYYNMTFRAFINDRRIKAAKNLLMNEPHCTLEDVAGRCGFQSSSQFSRKFKEMEGVTPREWQSDVNLL